MTGCGHLCASSKRMRRHWSDSHGVSVPSNIASHARSVKLQTFFRGTKLKYFEVSEATRAADSQGFNEGSGHDRMGSDADKVPSLAQPMSFSESSLVVDLETLAYFHHYIITTCPTLPKIEDSLTASQHWGTYIVSLALRRRWLMCGLLAISAYHSATLDEEITVQKKHFEQGTKLRSEFFIGFNEIMNNSSNTMSIKTFQKTKRAAIQVKSIMSCAHWALTGFTSNYTTVLGPDTVLSQLQSLLCDIQDFSKLGNSLNIEQRNGNDLQTSLGTNGSRGTATAPTMLLNRLQMLPYRMAEIFGKPDHEQDAPAILLSIAALLQCCSGVFESNNLSGAWKDICAWFEKTTDHFNYMVSLQNPAALIVLAYWAAILVKQAQVCECWFVHGFSRAIVLLIYEHLSTDDAVRSLVERLLE
ncbi:uncharacterized protein N7479_002797 [Penicillium vulpinum]|uniref:Transcription factor domain-containing protein n=1 Tax=Penicillium vulpinum TaxID=29845 RepID=A0A1V6RTF5_9EURO|nr:uncharacterized protein N7479_002797 [Penicillium vulpinum]KAJ5972879.1 hypothetical protein N7479_002797 [Penicillium vulpinum]OQE04693.1 hypothetical protein PENVUL_c030G09551 [Penicillium vulpinum]